MLFSLNIGVRQQTKALIYKKYMDIVQKGSKLHLAYSLETEDCLLEEVQESDNFVIEVGAGRMHPSLESILVGKSSGQCFESWIDSELAFGKRDPELNFEIHKNKIARICPDWKIGMSFEAPDKKGNKKLFRIVSFNEPRIEIDGNHPFSGEDLLFKGKICSVG